MTCDEFISYIESRTSPYTFRENGRAHLSDLFRRYPEELLMECIDIGIKNYFRYDDNGDLSQDSVGKFLDKLGGIAFNKSRSPVDQEINHLKNKGNYQFSYWNQTEAEDLLQEYVKALRTYGYSESMVLTDLQTDSTRMMNRSKNWSSWSDTMRQWIDEIYHWNDDDNETISQSGAILPDVLFSQLPSNIQSLCKQINASYENHLYDCAAVVMRRLLEVLLVMSYQAAGIEDDIMDKNGNHHVTLDKMIKNAEQNRTLALSSNTKKDMAQFKDLGNYSAHKIWYNCTQGDIKPHILKYRAIIEELLYKAGLK